MLSLVRDEIERRTQMRVYVDVENGGHTVRAFFPGAFIVKLFLIDSGSIVLEPFRLGEEISNLYLEAESSWRVAIGAA